MKNFILKLLLFIGLVIVADYAIGSLFYVYKYVKGGTIGKTHQVMTKIEPDILIMGSSRASHHYNSDIISKKFGIEAYNAGFDGQGTLMAYGLLNGVRNRHNPKIILYELTPLFDIYKDSKSSDINILSPYSSKFGLDELFNDIDKTNKYKMLSKSYQYNSVIFRIIPNLISDRTHSIKGFEPLNGSLNSFPTIENKKTHQALETDTIKLKYFNQIIKDAKDSGCKLFFLISPSLNNHNIENYNVQLEIAYKNNIKVFNHLQDTTFINHPELFQDAVHMNEKGTNRYSEIIAEEILEYLQKNQ